MSQTDSNPDVPSSASSSPARVLILLGLAVLCGFGVARWLESRQTSVLRGRLHASETIVQAPQAGRLQEIAAKAGEKVDANKRIVVLVDEEVDRRLDLARQRVATLELELAQAQAKAEVDLAWRLRTIEGDRHETRLKQATFLQQKLDSELHTQAIDERMEGESQVELAGFGEDESDKKNLDLRLKREGAVNAGEVAAAQVALCDRRLAQLDRLAEQLPQRLKRASGVEALEARLTRARADLAKAETESSAIDVCAAQAGTLGRWEKRVGDQVAAGEPLVTIFDDGRRHVLVHIPAGQMDQYAESTEVTLVFPGRIQRKGVVAAVLTSSDSSATTAGKANCGGPYHTLRVDAVDVWPDSPIGSAIEIRAAQ